MEFLKKGNLQRKKNKGRIEWDIDKGNFIEEKTLVWCMKNRLMKNVR
jgi:hypothetical protein